ncbi:MAG: dienelactone hydrolase family protein [Candidatus Bathyarchaeota archaeon]|nr:dienelactone hydrolase family protein [Candidatus Bathyarchaeum tardum]WGM90556.1 MAG: dienelactone hydrolase family protein [Candidatus Bathyarchaeum tardum]
MFKENEYVKIPLNELVLEGNLNIPPGAKGLVIFAHGSGSSRFSPRNNFVAQKLQSNGLATLLMDLLTQEEEKVDVKTRQFRFNIKLLSERLVGVLRWVKSNESTKSLKVGYFGSSTGAAAALIAAALEKNVDAIVSRGGRTDLAGSYLPQVEAPTLLIVGSNDVAVLNLNIETLNQLKTEKKLEIISGASHLFEEPGTLEQVAERSADWFKTYFD